MLRTWGMAQPLSEDCVQKAVLLLQECQWLSMAAIARRLSVSRSTIQKINRREKIRAPGPTKFEEVCY